MNTHLRSSVLLLECGLAGLCGGRLRGPSILRDINESLREQLSLALKIPFEVVIVVACGPACE